MNDAPTSAGGDALVTGVEHWTHKGDVRLFLWEKYAGSPEGKKAVLFVHGSSMASQPTFDLTVPGRLHTVHSMVEIMTRFLGLGFTLPQVVTMSTANPAKAIGAEHRLGSLAVGRQADISVLDIREGDWTVYDVLKASMRVTRAFVPFVTVKKGVVFTPDWGPRPWGWEPDRTLPAGAPGGGCC